MVEESDLAVVGRVNSVGQLVLNEEDQQGVWYYDATLIVEETLFGSPRQQVPAVARRDSPIVALVLIGGSQKTPENDWHLAADPIREFTAHYQTLGIVVSLCRHRRI